MKALDTFALSRLIENLNAPCACEAGKPHWEDCREPIDRWWRHWGRDHKERVA